MRFFIHKGTTTLFFLAVSLVTTDMAVGLAGESTEQAIKTLCDGRVRGASKNVEEACAAVGCSIGNYPCSAAVDKKSANQ